MDKSLKKLELFFKYNMEIKRLLHICVPNEKDFYNDNSTIDYCNKLYNSINTIETYFVNTCNVFETLETLDYIEKIFTVYKNELLDCGINQNKLRKFYQDYFSNLSPDLVEKTKQYCQGYILDSAGFALVNEAKTINELLHVFHSKIVNDEEYYHAIKPLAIKENIAGELICLLGNKNDLSKAIFDKFPKELDTGQVDILSLNDGKKILLMIRDVGHALSIEIDVSDNNCLVNYFIPKVCNYLMVNELKGVRKVTPNSKMTVGMFESKKDDLAYEVVDLVSKVPGDMAQFVKGGTCYNQEDNLIRK